jgi:hypothetical protein
MKKRIYIIIALIALIAMSVAPIFAQSTGTVGGSATAVLQQKTIDSIAKELVILRHTRDSIVSSTTYLRKSLDSISSANKNLRVIENYGLINNQFNQFIIDSLSDMINRLNSQINELQVLNTIDFATDATIASIKDNQTNNSQTTQIVDGLGNVISNFGTVEDIVLPTISGFGVGQHANIIPKAGHQTYRFTLTGSFAATVEPKFKNNGQIRSFGAIYNIETATWQGSTASGAGTYLVDIAGADEVFLDVTGFFFGSGNIDAKVSQSKITTTGTSISGNVNVVGVTGFKMDDVRTSGSSANMNNINFGFVYPTAGHQSFYFNLQGTWVGQIKVGYSLNGTPIGFIPRIYDLNNGGVQLGTNIITANGNYIVECLGMDGLFLSTVSWTSGTVFVDGKSTAAAFKDIPSSGGGGGTATSTAILQQTTIDSLKKIAIKIDTTNNKVARIETKVSTNTLQQTGIDTMKSIAVKIDTTNIRFNRMLDSIKMELAILRLIKDSAINNNIATRSLLSETMFTNRIPTNGQKVSSGSVPTVQASNQTEVVAKEWKSTTISGTPATIVGDILLQSVRNNGGAYQVYWFNLTQNVLMTVAPTAGTFTQNTNTGQNLPSNQNGRQSWAAWSQNNGTMTSTATGFVAQVVVDGVNISSGTTYTVPAGKRLRITSFQGGGFTAGFGPANGAAYDEGYWWLAQAAAVNTGSPNIAQISFGVNYINPTSGSATPTWNATRYFGDGEVDIPGGQQIMFVGKTLNNTMGFRASYSWAGYLYNQ